MKKQIELGDKKIEYTLRLNRHSRNMRLVISGDGDMAVSAPSRMSLGVIEKFIAQKSQWIFDKFEHFKKNPQSILRKGSEADYKKLKEDAHFFAENRLEHFSKIYGIPYGKVRIRNQKTRWGSCSRKGNIAFNYKIVLLSQELGEYIVVHELCHIKEFNHSQKFWNLVGQTMPDYKEKRRRLKRM